MAIGIGKNIMDVLDSAGQKRLRAIFAGLPRGTNPLQGKKQITGSVLQRMKNQAHYKLSSSDQAFLNSLSKNLGGQRVGAAPAGQLAGPFTFGKNFDFGEGQEKRMRGILDKFGGAKGLLQKNVLRSGKPNFTGVDLSRMINLLGDQMGASDLKFLQGLRGGVAAGKQPRGPGAGQPTGPGAGGPGGLQQPIGPEGFGPHPDLQTFIDQYDATQIPDWASFPVPPPHTQLPYYPGPGRAQDFVPWDPANFTRDASIQGPPIPPPMQFMAPPDPNYAVPDINFPEVHPLLGNYSWENLPGGGGGAGSGGGQDLPPREDEGELAE